MKYLNRNLKYFGLDLSCNKLGRSSEHIMFLGECIK